MVLFVLAGFRAGSYSKNAEVDGPVLGWWKASDTLRMSFARYH